MLCSDDLDWLKVNFSGLMFDAGANKLYGNLDFRMVYSSELDVSVINPDETINGILIEDSYDLEIMLNENSSRPCVREVGGRIISTKEKWGFKTLSDVHMYSDQSLCLCPAPDEILLFSNGFSIREFFYQLLIPNLYYHSYLERYGREPWKSSSHGDLGVLESYLRRFGNKQYSPKDIRIYLESLTSKTKETILKNKLIKGHNLCLCNSGKIFRKCHLDALNGYKKLCDDLFLARHNLISF
jgi:hypothetical protein